MHTELTLHNLKFQSRHGLEPQERVVGASYTLNVTLTLDVAAATIDHDDISGTVNYAEAYQAIRAEMDIPSHLIEHAAARIARRLLRDFPQVQAVDITLQKDNPPIGADTTGISVRQRWQRQAPTE